MKILKIILTLYLSLVSLYLLAIPAKPGLHLFQQPDGSTVSVYIRGDEFSNFYESTDGQFLKINDRGVLCYANIDAKGNIVASKYKATNLEMRSAEETLYLSTINKADIKKAFNRERDINMQSRIKAPGIFTPTFPTIGRPKGLVILAQYQDIKFCEDYPTLSLYQDLVNAENYTGEYSTGSVRDYYSDQSGQLFIPEFDVVGPVTLPQNRGYYGGANGGKENVSQMMIDACLLADAQCGVDFSQYDMNNDGFVDFIYVVYAGHGEAQGGPAESVWPQSWTLEYVYYKKLDGKYLGRYACSCELSGGSGNTLDGIGTFCHEYGHILGLPDVYDAAYSGYFGMGHWDPMDIGAYNNNSKTPAAFTSLERYSLGWMEPKVLNSFGSFQLSSLETSNEAYFLIAGHDNNEYYIFENRQPDKWDAHLPGSGLLISHIHYVPTYWNINRVNSASSGYEHIALVAADNKKNMEDEDGDVFPGKNNVNSFTDFTTPSAVWHNGQKVGVPITNIQELDRLISFDIANSSGVGNVNKDLPFSATITDGKLLIDNSKLITISVYTVGGENIYTGSNEQKIELALPMGIYIINDSHGNSLKVYVK